MFDKAFNENRSNWYRIPVIQGKVSNRLIAEGEILQWRIENSIEKEFLQIFRRGDWKDVPYDLLIKTGSVEVLKLLALKFEILSFEMTDEILHTIKELE